ncbi:MAG: hypothetical protein R3F14_22895 [Polyangiaceae bacterium]
MPISQDSDGILRSLQEAGVELVVVGGTAAVLQGAPVVTFDLDIVYGTPENVSRLRWLLAHGAYHRLDLANRKLPPAEDALLGQAPQPARPISASSMCSASWERANEEISKMPC